MIFKEVVELLSITTTEDGAGGFTTTETARFVFANRSGVVYREFYKAHEHGLRPEANFKVRSIDYEDEPKLRWNGKDYDIIRTFAKNDEFVELICSRRTEVSA